MAHSPIADVDQFLDFDDPRDIQIQMANNSPRAEDVEPPAVTTFVDNAFSENIIPRPLVLPPPRAQDEESQERTLRVALGIPGDGEPLSEADRLRLEAFKSTFSALAADNRELRARLDQVEQHAFAPPSSRDTHLPDYEFEPEIADELARNPRFHSYLPLDLFKEEMRRVPFHPAQTVTTSLDSVLGGSLSAADKFKIARWTDEERRWSPQLRVSAYALDVLIKARRSYDDDETGQNPPPDWLDHAVCVASSAFFLTTGARRSLAEKKLQVAEEAVSTPGVLVPEQDSAKRRGERVLVSVEDRERIVKARRLDTATRSLADRIGSRTSTKSFLAKGSRNGRPTPRVQAPTTQSSRSKEQTETQPQDLPPRPKKPSRGRGHGRGRGRGRGGAAKKPSQSE